MYVNSSTLILLKRMSLCPYKWYLYLVAFFGVLWALVEVYGRVRPLDAKGAEEEGTKKQCSEDMLEFNEFKVE